MKFIFLYFLGLTMFFLQPDIVSAQVISQSDSSLHVGDRLPQNIYLKTTNYSGTTASIKDFHAPLLIIDFWNSHCIPCYRAFPHLEELEKHFAGKLKILLVTDDDSATLFRFLNTRKKLNLSVTSLPIAYHEKKLEKLFDHLIESHEVWIDETGTVVQITGSEEVTAENIQCVLNKDTCQIRQKEDFAVPYDGMLPLFKNNNGGNGSQMFYHSELSHYISGLAAMAGYHYNPQKPYGEDVFGFVYINGTPISLYRTAWDVGPWDDGQGEMGVPQNRTILELKDSMKYCQFIGGKQAFQNLYCYDLIVPNSTKQGVKKIMLDDLNRYFGLHTGMEKRKMKCLVLKMADTLTICKNTTEKPYWDIKDFAIEMRNAPFEKFMFWLINRYTYKYPLIDETGIKGKVSFEFKADLSNFQSVAEAIKKYNMDLVLEDKEIDVLVIRD